MITILSILIILIILIFYKKNIKTIYKNNSKELFRVEKKSKKNIKEIIPPILYKTGPLDYENLDQKIKDNFELIEKENPNYTIKYYSDKDSRNFIKNNFDKEVLTAYDKIKPGSYKADLFRYCILYKNGGFYGDLAQKYFIKLDDLVDRNKDKLFLSRDTWINEYNLFSIDISFMASIKNLKIFDNCIKEIVNNVQNNFYGANPLDVTGPALMGRNFIKNIEARDLYTMVIKNDCGEGYIVDKNNKKIIKRKLGKKNEFQIYMKKYRPYGDQWYNKDIYTKS